MIATLPASGPGPEAAGAATADVGTVVDATLEWTFNPWRQDVRTALVGAFVVAGGTAAVAVAGLPPLAIVALALAFLANAYRAVVPTRCRVDASGVACRIALGWQRLPWDAIRRASLGSGGLVVSTKLEPGLLDRYHGRGRLWLPVPRDASPALWAEMREVLASHHFS